VGTNTSRSSSASSHPGDWSLIRFSSVQHPGRSTDLLSGLVRTRCAGLSFDCSLLPFLLDCFFSPCRWRVLCRVPPLPFHPDLRTALSRRLSPLLTIMPSLVFLLFFCPFPGPCKRPGRSAVKNVLGTFLVSTSRHEGWFLFDLPSGPCFLLKAFRWLPFLEKWPR